MTAGAGSVAAELLGLLDVLGPAAVKTLGLLLAGWLVARLVGRRSAAVKHLVWIATLAGCLLLPLAEAGLPRGLRLDAAPVAGAVAEGVQAAVGLLGGPEAVGPAPGTAAGEEAASGRRGAAAAGGEAGAPGTAGGVLAVLAVAAALAWLVGTLAVVLRTAWGLFRLARIRRRASPLEDVGEGGDDGRRLGRLRRLAAGSDLDVRVSPEVSLPVVQGILRPTLLVPQEALDEWPADRTRAVLLHEAGHVERRDFASHLLARLACALYWFNPLVWWAAREARKEQERACDDAVLRAGHRPSTYARHLLTIAREGAGAATVAGVSMAHWPDLEGRVVALLREDVDRSPARSGWLAGVAVPAAVLVLGLSALSFTRADGAPGASPAAAGAAPPAGPASAESHGRAGPAREGRGADLPRAAGDEGREDGAVDRLVAALEHPAADVRKDAAHRLGELEVPTAVPALERAMMGDERRRVRRAAAWAIGESESVAAVEALRRGLAAVDGGKLRRTIVRALGETERPSAVPLIAGELESPDRKARWHALVALAENETGRARAALRDVLAGDDAGLREMARRVLLERRKEKERRDGQKKHRDGEKHRDEEKKRGR